MVTMHNGQLQQHGQNNCSAYSGSGWTDKVGESNRLQLVVVRCQYSE